MNKNDANAFEKPQRHSHLLHFKREFSPVSTLYERRIL